MSNRTTDNLVSFDIFNVLIKTFNITYVAFTLFAVDNTGLQSWVNRSFRAKVYASAVSMSQVSYPDPPIHMKEKRNGDFFFSVTDYIWKKNKYRDTVTLSPSSG